MSADTVRIRLRALERALDAGDVARIAVLAARLNDVVIDLDDDSGLGLAVAELGLRAELWAAGLATDLDIGNARRALDLCRRARMSDGAQTPY
ncbi:hypothetical protein ACPXB3_14860 [Gordonia sp. DT219]|uniref:hypothetical protein n=1 Tax=Gordonia sp. DT219 TaxID=3416658 RepID=UPI003CEDAA0C